MARATCRHQRRRRGTPCLPPQAPSSRYWAINLSKGHDHDDEYNGACCPSCSATTMRNGCQAARTREVVTVSRRSERARGYGAPTLWSSFSLLVCECAEKVISSGSEIVSADRQLVGVTSTSYWYSTTATLDSVSLNLCSAAQIECVCMTTYESGENQETCHSDLV